MEDHNELYFLGFKSKLDIRDLDRLMADLKFRKYPTTQDLSYFSQDYGIEVSYDPGFFESARWEKVGTEAKDVRCEAKIILRNRTDYSKNFEIMETIRDRSHGLLVKFWVEKDQLNPGKTTIHSMIVY